MSTVLVVIRAAAGPHIGYGHLVRARSLARALGGAVVTVRGGKDARLAAERLRLRITTRPLDDLLTVRRPAVVVIDDPSMAHARAALGAARRHRLPALSVHDLGIAPIASDVAVDGTIAPGCFPGVVRACRGPRFAILDPAIRSARAAAPGRRGRHVLIALGGGPHVRAAGAIAAAIARRVPGTRVRIAGGFATDHGHRNGRDTVRWLEARTSLLTELQRCQVAVVAGGMTMYEAAALGTPTVGVAVVRAQQGTVQGFAARGATVDGGVAVGRDWLDDGPQSIAGAVEHLLQDAKERAHVARRASTLVDGLGACRVAQVIRTLTADRALVRRAG